MNIKIFLHLILGILLLANGFLQHMGQAYIVHAGICIILIGLIFCIFHKTLVDEKKKPNIRILSEVKPIFLLIGGFISIGGGILYIWHGLKITGSVS